MDMQEEAVDTTHIEFGPQLPDKTSISSFTTAEQAQVAYALVVPEERAVASGFWSEFSHKWMLWGLKACMLIFLASGGCIVPREFQLKATMALCSGFDALIDVGTGYGKTFCMILPALLFNGMITLVVSPLKKLQEMQVLEFRKYGLSALAINEDTGNDKELWKDIANGAYSVLVVTAEQFFVDKGHWPRMARLINKRKFSSKVRFLFVDEAHSIYTFGASLYGQPAFRPAWSYLADLRTKLGSQVSVAALSGTMPKHMKTVIRETLQFDDETLCEIKLSCNRPNIAYAKHAIVGNLTDYRNLDFLISDETGSNAPDRVRRKTIVFHDRITDATGAKEHQEQQLPEANRGKGVIAYYHAGMSKQYLQRVHDDFRDPNGVCEILHATECASTGLDIRDVHCVIQYGLPRDMTTLQQRAGRPGRDGITNSVYVLLYEPFALTADLSPAREAEKMSDSPLDPDRPITGKLKPRGHKLHRIGVSVYDLVQDEDRCIRGDFASYNNDTSEHALKFTGPFCCNGKIHGDRPFDFGYYFPSKLLYFDATTKLVYRGNPNDPNRTLLDPPTGTKRKAARNKYRPVAFRASLVSRLEKFRLDEWQASKNHRVLHHPSFILTNKQLTLIARIPPDQLTTPEMIIKVLGDDLKQDLRGSIWEQKYAQKVFDIVKCYDAEVGSLKEMERAKKEERIKRSKEEARDRAIREAQERFKADSLAREEAAASRARELIMGSASTSIFATTEWPTPSQPQNTQQTTAVTEATNYTDFQLTYARTAQGNLQAFQEAEKQRMKEIEDRIKAQLKLLRQK